jgi:hydroxyacyl-ACP dehydratase HTD2-like protein with hotdog domain
MVAKESLGAAGTTFTMDIERGKIYEFARATRSDHPMHFLEHKPVIPPTFLTTTFFWEERVENANPWELVQMSQERGMHAEQEYIFHGPPPVAGTQLTCTSRIDKIYEKESRSGGTLTFVIMVTEYRDADEVLVAEARLTGVERAATETGDNP